MNYFKVKSVGVKANNVSLIEVECVQQRRLPYLQIIGGPPAAAVSQRERVMAALESSGFRFPSRRITVSLSGWQEGMEPESTDLAVALAILGGAKAFPAPEGEIIALGALALDGRILPGMNRAPLRLWAQSGRGSRLLLPYADADLLGQIGFSHLSEVVRFLRDGGVPAYGSPEMGAPQGSRGRGAEDWEKLRGNGLAQRVALLAAAGGHSVFSRNGSSSRACALGKGALSLLPEPDPVLSEEIRAVHVFYGETPTGRPWRELRGAHFAKLCQADARSGYSGELSLAHGGALFLGECGDKPELILEKIAEPLSTARIRSMRRGQSMWRPADWILFAHSALCACGGGKACVCAPADAERFRQRLGKVTQRFHLQYLQSEPSLSDPGISYERALALVARARERSAERKAAVNARLSLEECWALVSWSAQARKEWELTARRLGPIFAKTVACIAITACDLREGSEISREDILEAKHYVPGFVAGSRSGIILSRTAFPERNSTAMP